MKDMLHRIRAPKERRSRRSLVLGAAGALLLGLLLGVFAKWLDNLVLDGSIWWQRPIEALDLRNVFSGFPVWLVLAMALSVCSASPARAAMRTFLFFAGMCAAYHLYTLRFSGFDPGVYMRIWYAVTLFSPVLAVVCWYSKGKTLVSILLDIGILAVLAGCCFSVGWLYFAPNGILNTLLFAAGAAILFSSVKQTLLAVPASLLLAVAAAPLLHLILPASV